MSAACGRVTVRAPAKVNLIFRVVGRRSDGYHLIESLMVPVSIYDELEIAVRPGVPRVACRVVGPSEVKGGPMNLAAQAARRVLAELNARAAVEIKLRKRIPAGAGLGGGSSDAAAVLRVLPRLLGRRLGQARLLELGAALGADVPFFVFGRPAVARGIGEQLEPVADFPPLALLVTVPPARVPTAWAYARALGSLTSKKRRNTRALRPRPTLAGIVAALHNDFQAGVGRAFDDVPRLVSTLRGLGARGVVMSGSGSAVVGVFESLRKAREAAEAIAPPDLAFVARVLRGRPAPIWR